MIDIKLKTLLVNELLQHFPEPEYRLVITKNKTKTDANNVFRIICIKTSDQKSINIDEKILTDMELKFNKSWSFAKNAMYDSTIHTNVYYVLSFIENFDFFENMLINDPNDFFQFD